MEKKLSKTSLTYKDAGVDIDAGNALVENIKAVAKKTRRPGTLSGLGGFGALFEIPTDRYQQPVLVSGTDGVGTKLKLALAMQQHTTIGIDLVAMCANDLIVQGAEPLYFLDYYATSKLDVAIASEVVNGIGEGCLQAGCALIGGETAEMPGIYQHGDYDLAGFCVGIVEKQAIIDGNHVLQGDAIIALASSGPHSNGYSLIHKILQHSHTELDSPFADSTIGQHLLTPTKIYVNSVLNLLKKYDIHAISHITGGGLLENIPRILPPNVSAELDSSTWELPKIFKWLQEKGNVSDEEMQRTFNCGIGMLLILPQQQASACLQTLQALGEPAWQVGQVTAKGHNPAIIIT